MSATKMNKGAESQRESAVLDQLLAGCEKPEDLPAPGGAFNQRQSGWFMPSRQFYNSMITGWSPKVSGTEVTLLRV
jgi:hypothetical protein